MPTIIENNIANFFHSDANSKSTSKPTDRSTPFNPNNISANLSEKEQEYINNVNKQLDKLRAELDSISHERNILDLLSKPLVAEIQSKAQINDTALDAHIRAQLAGIYPSNRYMQPKNAPTPQGNPSHSFQTPPKKNIYSDLGDLARPIPIPSYIPPYGTPVIPHKPQQIPTVSTSTRPAATYNNVPSFNLNRVSAKGVHDVTIVPNVKIGKELPPDLKEMKLPLHHHSNSTTTKKK